MTPVHLIVVLGLTMPAAGAFVASIHGPVILPRDRMCTASLSARMSDTAAAARQSLEQLFMQPSFHTVNVHAEKEHQEKDPHNSLGRDPRGPLPRWATTEAVEELMAKSASVPKLAAVSKTPAISSIQTVSELDTAVATRPLVVVKYYAPWCRSCMRIKPTFERFANGVTEIAQCLEVEYDASRLLAKLAGLERLPCVQIYKDGALVDTHNIGNKERFAKFEESFQHLQRY